MSKFKVGDRVRFVGKYRGSDDFTPGKEYEVGGKYHNAEITGVLADDRGEQNGWKNEYFELVSPTGPVVEETVTVRRIVPGVYGRLNIGPGMLKSPTVLMGVEDGIYTRQTHWTVAELRAAAAVLTQLADALEQN